MDFPRFTRENFLAARLSGRIDSSQRDKHNGLLCSHKFAQLRKLQVHKVRESRDFGHATVLYLAANRGAFFSDILVGL